MLGTNETFRRLIKTFVSQDDLERRAATGQVKRALLTVAIDRHIVERDFQTACIDTLRTEIVAARHKILVEMVIGGGKAHEATEHPAEEASVA
jgi:type I restriction enzyme, R subunit